MNSDDHWSYGEYDKGIRDVTLDSWKSFSVFITDVLLEYRVYIYRGQANDQWVLEPSLDRILRGTWTTKDWVQRHHHLENFKRSALGRRGTSPSKLEDDNDWWALGQHRGLKTPLLDWTESPFVALYFAFKDLNDQGSKYRVVFAMSENAVESKSKGLMSDYEIRWAKRESKTNGRFDMKTMVEEMIEKGNDRPRIVEIIRPTIDEGASLISQRGLFTKTPDGVSLESWVRDQFSNETSAIILYRLFIPNNDRESCLQFLNRMNINHLTLFPDLYGAAEYCNTGLTIPNY